MDTLVYTDQMVDKDLSESLAIPDHVVQLVQLEPLDHKDNLVMMEHQDYLEDLDLLVPPVKEDIPEQKDQVAHRVPLEVLVNLALKESLVTKEKLDYLVVVVLMDLLALLYVIHYVMYVMI